MTELSRVVFEQVPADIENALRVQELARYDLMSTLGLSLRDATEVADPKSPRKVLEQWDRLDRARRGKIGTAYIGAYMMDELVGYMKVGVWRRPDDMIYANNRIIRLGQKVVGHYAPEYPGDRRGIHGLVVDGDVDDTDTSKIFTEFAIIATQIRDHTPVEVFIPFVQDGRDPAEPTLRQRGFQPTGRIGAPVANIPQELFRYSSDDPEIHAG